MDSWLKINITFSAEGALVKKVKTKKRAAGRPISSLEKSPKTMAALARAQRITERASHVGFDWPSPEPVWGKIEEELSELKTAIASGDRKNVKEEMGDLIFSLVNLSRFLGLEAEEALSQSVDRFLKRFHHIEKTLGEREKTPAGASLEEMDALWEEAKKMERTK